MKVLFGHHPDWEDWLRRGSEAAGYEFAMRRLEEADFSGFDMVVPLRESERAALARRAAAGEAIAAIYTSAEAEALCADKLAFNRAMIRAGLGAYIPALLPCWPADPGAYPVIVKQRRDRWGQNSHVVTGPPGPGVPLEHETQFLQAYIPGAEEWATHLLLRDGQVMFEASIRYTMPDGPYVKGKHARALRGQWQGPSAYLPLFRRMLDQVGFGDGTCCFDYRICDGRVFVFEVNPRFGGSLCGRIGPYLNAYRQTLAIGAERAAVLPG